MFDKELEHIYNIYNVPREQRHSADLDMCIAYNFVSPYSFNDSIDIGTLHCIGIIYNYDLPNIVNDLTINFIKKGFSLSDRIFYSLAAKTYNVEKFKYVAKNYKPDSKRHVNFTISNYIHNTEILIIDDTFIVTATELSKFINKIVNNSLDIKISMAQIFKVNIQDDILDKTYSFLTSIDTPHISIDKDSLKKVYEYKIDRNHLENSPVASLIYADSYLLINISKEQINGIDCFSFNMPRLPVFYNIRINDIEKLFMTIRMIINQEKIYDNIDISELYTPLRKVVLNKE